MNIDSLKCFILVAENLNFARAAEAMYKSQPAVTKQINTLEEELGVALFIRSTRHVELTPAGMSFYKDAKDIVFNSQKIVCAAVAIRRLAAVLLRAVLSRGENNLQPVCKCCTKLTYTNRHC